MAIKELCERYIKCPIIDPSTDEEIDGYISIGDGEYTFLTNKVNLEVNLDGGTTSQIFEKSYVLYTIIKMINPTKENNYFLLLEDR